MLLLKMHNAYSAANIAVIRHMSLNMLKAEKNTKLGIKNKCLGILNLNLD